MRRWGFFPWVNIGGAMCLTAGAVIGYVNGQWLGAAIETVGSICFVAAAVLAGKRDRASQHFDQRST